MKTNNIFEGDSYHALFAQVTYKRLMSRKWVTYADIMADYLGLKSSKELTCNVSNCDNYGELKKAFRDIRKAIIEKVGDGCFEDEGNNRNKRFRYIGMENDPLADMRNAKVINNLRQYWKFCQDSAGFFPKSWLEYFFKDCQDLLEMRARKQKGQQVISASLDRILATIEYLPMLYEAIVNKQVLEIDYKPFGGEQETLIFHPHYLKEYNGRWNLFGHAEDHSPENGYNIPLDRIQTKPREKSKIEYIPAPSMFYEQFFKDIVGVSHTKNAAQYDIVIRAHTYYIYKLTETKPIHQPQEIITPWGEHEDGTYGEFSIHVEVNNELIGRILQMGAGLEIVSPLEVRDLFTQRVKDLAKLYE
ncbi:MAG: WYL domain-containing protein [Paludibacteraceae bacterium]|nr:WYL domain-containing protein [Paludibacteraceae bacterium]